MERIRPETELDRTRQSVLQEGGIWPLRNGDVEVVVTPQVAATSAGQQALTLMVNELARMKGLIGVVHVVGAVGVPIAERVPLSGPTLRDGLETLVDSLNHPDSEVRAEISFAAHQEPVARATLGTSRRDGLVVGADAWRGLLGRYAKVADWSTASPIGAALAAALAAAEITKQVIEANLGPDPLRHLVRDLALSAYNYGANGEAAPGPEFSSVDVDDWAVVGCGAGGSAALYVLAMAPNPEGRLALIEPARHKLSNLNRYLATTARDVHEGLPKLESITRHLRQYAPSIGLDPHPQAWEMLTAPKWPHLIATVDTVETRWEIQARAILGAEIVDAGVLGLYYGLLRVMPGGWCLQCKHPLDPDRAIKARAKRWGVRVETVRQWEEANTEVSDEMVIRLTEVQNKPRGHYQNLMGLRFRDVPTHTECGDTPLRTDQPSQAPSLPLATTAAGVLLAAEVVKSSVAPDTRLTNWWGHDLGQGPRRSRLRWRSSRRSCPRKH